MHYAIRSALITITAAMLLGSGPALGLALTPTENSGPALGSIAAGFGHSCAVRTDGTLACWGNNSSGQSTPPAGTFTQVAAGKVHTCGLKTDGTIACWGDNGHGQVYTDTHRKDAEGAEK